MQDLNLITQEDQKVKGTRKLHNSLVFACILTTLISIAGIVVFVSFYLINMTTIASIKKSQDDLRQSIQSQKKAETQYVLLKDRAKLIAEAFSKGNATNDLKNIYAISADLADKISISSLKISKNSIKVDFTTDSTFSLSDAFTVYITQQDYGKVTMDGFDFSNEDGYQVKLSLAKI